MHAQPEKKGLVSIYLTANQEQTQLTKQTT